MASEAAAGAQGAAGAASMKERVSASLRQRFARLPSGVREALGERHSERLTEKARQALLLAVEEGRRMNHTYIGTEHVLLGLAAGNGQAGRVLADLDVGLDQVREAVEYVVGRGSEPAQGEI